MKLNLIQKNILACLLGLTGVLLMSNTVQAAIEDSFVFVIEATKLTNLASSILGIITGMTDIAILPMGLSASIKTFRHIVLRNV